MLTDSRTKLLSVICVNMLSVTAGALLLQSPPSVSVTPGSKVILSCDITQMGGQCSHVVWLHVGQMSNVSVSTQFVSRGQSGMLCTLDIPHAALQDAGRYYCAYINGLMLLTGGGTTLTVTESRLQHPEVHLLVPADPPVDSPVPLICRASGLEDAGRVSVDWEVDETELQRPIILSGSEAGVISVQVYVPAATWSAGVQVSCVLTDGEMSIRKTASIKTGVSGHCVSLTSLLGAMCVVMFIVAVTLSILLSCQQRQVRRKSDAQSNVNEEVSEDLHYAALKFEKPGRRNI
ncbi:hypothetical protein PAMA_020112 [Pampus argenteus]